MLRQRTLRWSVVGLGLLIVVRPIAADDDATSVPPIESWIEQLDSDSYQTRELATRHLIQHGGQALDKLAAAADGERPEVAARAITVLEELATRGDDHLTIEALLRLTGLSNRTAASLRARERLAGASLPIALELGGRLDDQLGIVFVDEATGQLRSTKLILGKDWTGGNEGLIHVARLDFIYILSLRHTPVTAEGIQQLADMPALANLELYGVDLTDDELQSLREALPRVTFDVRSGAYLGVRGNRTSTSALVSQVEPDTAAERAGLQAGDVIVKVDDTDVASFDELTGEIAKRKPNESVLLTIQRNDSVIERKVTFGYWE